VAVSAVSGISIHGIRLMRVVLVGNRKLAKYVLRYLLEDDWNVVGAVAPAGRTAAQQANFTPFDDIVQEEDVELVETEDINDERTVAAIRGLEPDLVVCPGWSQIIDEAVLDIPSRGFTGFHSSDLPNGRGGAPVNWSMIHGEDEIQISYFYYTSGIDAGEILGQKSVPIEHRDDVSTLLEKLAAAARDVLRELKELLHDDAVEPTPQRLESATYRPRRKPKDGIIDWAKNPREQQNWIRAQTQPYPGAYTFFEQHRITIWESERPEREPTSPAEFGEVVSVDDQGGITVRSGEGNLRILRVQAGDDPVEWGDDFAERYGVSAGTTFGRHHAPESWLYTGIRDPQGGTHYTTNLRVGESGRINCIVESPGRTRQIEVVATFEGEPVLDKTIEVNGRTAEQCEYTPSSEGTKTLKVEYSHGDEYRDVRYLKVFAH
jgi:methionyl-tRNA formyltransferase